VIIFIGIMGWTRKWNYCHQRTDHYRTSLTDHGGYTTRSQ